MPSSHWPGLHFYLELQVWKTKIVSLSCPMYAILLQMLLQSNIPTPLWPPGFVCFTCSHCSYLLPCSPISSNSVSYTYFPLESNFLWMLFDFISYSLKCTKIQYLVLFLNQINKVNYLNSQLNDLLAIILLASPGLLISYCFHWDNTALPGKRWVSSKHLTLH